jgi:HEAT repeat protein
MQLFTNQAQRWAERACADPRWWRRLHAVRVLAVFGRGAETVPGLLADAHPLVRAEAAFWAGELRHAGSAAALVGIALGDAGLPVFAAQDALTRIGAPALGAIADALRATADPPRALMRVVTAVPDPALAGPVAVIAGRETYAERDLAVAALAAIGGPEARTVLVSALGDARPAVRAAAATGIGRVRDWQAAASLARAMTDPAWEVRRAAALALRELDAAGLLYLRSVMTGPDAYAADMARHVLALGARTA